MITLQGAIEKSPKMNDWMAALLFRILVVAIIFSPTVYPIFFLACIIDNVILQNNLRKHSEPCITYCKYF